MRLPGSNAIVRAFGVTAFVLALSVLIFRQDALGSIWEAIGNVSTVILLGALLLFAAARLVQALCFRQALLIFGERLSFLAALELCGTKGFYNLTFQGAGIVAQAASGNAKRAFRMRNFVASTVLQSLLLALAIGISVAALAFGLPEGALSRETALLFGTSVAITAIGLLIGLRHYRMQAVVFGPRLNSNLADIHQLLKYARPGSLMLASGYQLLFAWLRLTRLAFITVLLSSDVNIIEFSAIVFIADLASLIPITPGGIGVREFVIGAGGLAIGHMEALVAAAVVDRGVMVLGNLTHGLIVMVGNLARRRSG